VERESKLAINTKKMPIKSRGQGIELWPNKQVHICEGKGGGFWEKWGKEWGQKCPTRHTWVYKWWKHRRV